MHGNLFNAYIHSELGFNYTHLYRVNKEAIKFDLIKEYDVIIYTQTVVLPTLCLKKIKHEIFISASAKWILSDLKPRSILLGVE